MRPETCRTIAQQPNGEQEDARMWDILGELREHGTDLARKSAGVATPNLPI